MRDNETNAAEESVRKETVPQEEPYVYAPKGVGGFLLLLAVVLLLTPLKTILVDIPFVDANESMQLLIARIPAMKVSLRVHQAALLGLSILSIVAGYKLLKVVPGAVKFTKHYLIIAAIYPFVFPLLALALVGVPEGAYGSALRFYFTDALSPSDLSGTLLFTVVWYAYLCRSKRVRNTFVAE